jgi:hypothetical protein
MNVMHAFGAQESAQFGEHAGVLQRDCSGLLACFKADRESMFIPDGEYKYLVGRYISYLIKNSKQFLPQHKKLQEICDMLDENEFEDIMKHLLFHKQLKIDLWFNSRLLLQETHPRLIPLQNIIVELGERFERWHKQINSKKRSRRVKESILTYAYERLMMSLFRKKNWSRTDCAVMLEMYRNFYANGEWHTDMVYFFNKGLLKLSQYNIKPNASLFPHDPTDKRTLISELLLDALEAYNGNPDKLDKELRETLSLLTESEIDEVVADMKGLPKFTRIFEKHALEMWLYSLRMGGEVNILGECLRKLYHAGLTMTRYYKASLKGICVKTIMEANLPIENVPDCFNPWEREVFHVPFKLASRTYGYAYPSPESPIFFVGTVFEQSETDALSNSVVSCSSRSVAPHSGTQRLRKIKSKKWH